MHILIGLVLTVGVLWLWLGGHWFGRVLAFLLIATVAGLIGAWGGSSILFAPPHQVAVAHTEIAECVGKTDPFCQSMRSGVPEPIQAPAPIASPALEIIGALVGIVLAWPLSGIPIYHQRYQLTGSIARPRRGA
jgi:hypothetical protein